MQARFHYQHQKIIKREIISTKELKEKGVKYLVSHQNEGENLYAHKHGHPNRKDGIYSHISDYIHASDLNSFEEIKKIGDKVLYRIK